MSLKPEILKRVEIYKNLKILREVRIGPKKQAVSTISDRLKFAPKSLQIAIPNKLWLST
ncbi:hypothetical protein PL8927_40003 [Planktothrix serta PCC 8927]|uniref:Uncharacterized protein n=1 Tax=Planktothrix serta PCC 8927 TaxID=671068 RepID=A0A7Z9BJC1_9CYAN|nr:hypothetical protein PL8927_40003 [Planktothrix serta PCC 8927]